MRKVNEAFQLAKLNVTPNLLGRISGHKHHYVFSIKIEKEQITNFREQIKRSHRFWNIVEVKCQDTSFEPLEIDHKHCAYVT